MFIPKGQNKKVILKRNKATLKIIVLVSFVVLLLTATFVAGTGVLLADGTVKTIEEIKVGDKVKSYNEITKLIEYKTVSQTFTSEHDELINITVAEQTISSTINHPFLTQRGWVEASKLKVGDILLTDDYEKLPIEKIVIQKLEEQITFYNFEVDGNHNYFVGENIIENKNEFVLVHNACKPKSPVKLDDKFLKRNDIDPHSFKYEFVKKDISKYNIILDKADDMLWLQKIKPNSKSDEWIETFIKFIRGGK